MRTMMKAFSMIAPILAISLAACSGIAEKKVANPDPVSVKVGRVQKVQETETISVSGTISTPESPATVSFLVSGKVVLSVRVKAILSLEGRSLHPLN